MEHGDVTSIDHSGHWLELIRLRDELGPVFRDADFAELYPRCGQSALPPWKLALVTVMQFAEDGP